MLTLSQIKAQAQMLSQINYNKDHNLNNINYPSSKILQFNKMLRGACEGCLADSMYYGTSHTQDYYFQYECDSMGNLIHLLRQIYSPGVAWHNEYQAFYTYDSNGLVQSIIAQSSDPFNTGGAWVNTYRYSYNYDTSGTLITSYRDYWFSSLFPPAWGNEFFYTYTYDSIGNQSTMLEQKWVGAAWNNYYLHSYTYDSIGNQLSQINQSWSNTNAIWLNYWKETYTYFPNGEKNELLQTWNYAASAWENYSQWSYINDSNGNLAIIFGQGWDSTTSTWSLGVNVAQYIYPASCAGTLESIDEQTNLSKVNLFPNPTFGELIIENLLDLNSKDDKLNVKSIITIHNVFGDMLIQKYIQPQVNMQKIDISCLSSGIYFLRLVRNNAVQTVKVIKN